jgi:hypothetical protein
VGEEYLVFASDGSRPGIRRTDPLYTGLCSGNQPVALAQDWLDELGAGATGAELEPQNAWVPSPVGTASGANLIVLVTLATIVCGLAGAAWLVVAPRLRRGGADR